MISVHHRVECGRDLCGRRVSTSTANVTTITEFDIYEFLTILLTYDFERISSL